MIEAAENKIILQLETKYIKNFQSITKTAAIENNTSIHLEDLVNIEGIVISIPRTLSKEKINKGYSLKNIKIGDVAIFSFSIVYDFYQNTHNGEPLYKNLISIQGKEFWMADITKIYAVKRNGEIIMINGYVMATPFVEDKIFLTAASKKTKGVKTSEVMHVGNPKETLPSLTIKQGDTIYFNPATVQKYQINNKPFIILQQHQVLGKRASKSE